MDDRNRRPDEPQQPIKAELEPRVRSGPDLPVLGSLPPPPIDVPPSLAEQGLRTAAHAYSDNTKRKYRECWRTFESWCRVMKGEALPATSETVGWFVVWLAGAANVSPTRAEVGADLSLSNDDRKRLEKIAGTRPKKWSTISLHLTSIEKMHREKELVSPIGSEKLNLVLRSTANSIGTAATLARRPLLLHDVRRIVKRVRGKKLSRARQRAIVLVGFWAALRRSELVGLDVDDVSFDERGATIRIKKSKTDQAAKGDFVKILRAKKPKNIAACPVHALENWLQISRVKDGPLFRRIDQKNGLTHEPIWDQFVSLLVKRLCRRIGLDAKRYGAHSLRAGFVTTMVKRGVEPWKIARTTRHKSLQTLMRYIREHNLDKDNPAEGVL